MGLDGLPRPIHLEHGAANIQWDRDTDWVYDNLVHQERTIREEEGLKLERTGLHSREFIETHRYTLTKPVECSMEDSVHVFNDKNEAINELHRLRGVKYRNSRMYTVEMEECSG